MNIHAVTFRVAYDDDYDRRYESLTSMIRAHSEGKYWDETSAFVLLRSKGTAATLADAIVGSSEFDDTKDLLVVVNLSKKGYAPRGTYTDADLDLLMSER